MLTAAHPLHRRAPAAAKFASREPLNIYSFETRLGWMAAMGSGQHLLQLCFGYPSARAAEASLNAALVTAARRDAWCPSLASALHAYAAGEKVDFSDVCLELSYATPFARRVLEACREIPFGRTRSYGDLARLVDAPGAARAVGSVMAGNRHPLIVPCHRVVAAGGRVGHFSAPGGPQTKRRLLELEAVAIGERFGG